jgi:hypothetical protein
VTSWIRPRSRSTARHWRWRARLLLLQQLLLLLQQLLLLLLVLLRRRRRGDRWVVGLCTAAAR